VNGSTASSPASGRAGRRLLGAAVLLACAGGGFLAYRLLNPPPSLQVVPARAAQVPVTAVAPPAPAPEPQAQPPSHPIPEALPDLTLPGLDGRPHRLNEWQGRPLLVNFWATWCEPCRREIPLLKRLRVEHAKDHLEIVGIALDFRDPVQKYVGTNRMDYPVLVGEDGGYEAVAAFGMEPVLPFSAFADDQGRIVTLKVGELHRDEAELILDRIRDVQQGRLDLAAARERIAAGIQGLARARAGAGDAAAH
jgi:thiol-disulfide isomerase/thioredoxin